MSIRVSSLTKLYGAQKAVNDISFSLTKGEIVGFLGPNGAGKSTTMKIITGYLPPTLGEVSVCGFDVWNSPLEVRKRIGYLAEANPLYVEMYVREYLMFTASVHKLKNPTDRVEEVIKLTGLTKESNKKIGALSKGYKQRVGLAQAIVHNPEVLIFDEPTTGLDPNQLVEIRELIKRIGEQKTVLLSTHIMQEVQAMCSRVLIINNGKIVADDTIEGLQKLNSRQDTLIVTFVDPVSEQDIKELKNLQSYEALSPTKFRLFAADRELMRRELMQWSLDHNIAITTLNVETQTLEDVFRRLTV